MGRLVEMHWTCPSCDSDNLGRYRSCQKCGAVRGDNVKLRIPTHISYVDKETASKIDKRPDWLCDYCGSYNPANSSTCKHCGSSKEESTKDYTTEKTKEELFIKTNASKKREDSSFMERDQEEDDFKKVEDKTSIRSDLDVGNDFNKKRKFSTSKPRWKKISNSFVKKIATFGGVSLLVAAIVGLGVFLFAPKEKEFTITGVSWEREIRVEDYKPYVESDWSIPSGGRYLSEQLEVHHYEQVLDHYETVTEQKSEQVVDHYETVVVGYQDLGNGYAEEITENRPVYRTEYYTETHEEPVYRQDPVYQTKYTYEIYKWKYERSEKSNGTDKNPYWAEVNLRDNERESGRFEKYYIDYIDEKENSHSYTIDYEHWQEIDIGTTIRAKVNAFGISEILWME